jgi:hypothetical protein
MGSALTVIVRWKPSVGVLRLAFLCGVIGLIGFTIHYWLAVWNWSDHVFWPHAYYEKLAGTVGAFPAKDEDGRVALMIVRRGENRYPPEGFTKAPDVWGTPTKDEWARSNPAEPDQASAIAPQPPPPPGFVLDDSTHSKSATGLASNDSLGKLPDDARRESSKGDMALLTGEFPGMPSFVRLRSHPQATAVYYALLPNGYDRHVPYYYYLRFAALLAVPALGFFVPFALILSAAWVVDGFQMRSKA